MGIFTANLMFVDVAVSRGLSFVVFCRWPKVGPNFRYPEQRKAPVGALEVDVVTARRWWSQVSAFKAAHAYNFIYFLYLIIEHVSSWLCIFIRFKSMSCLLRCNMKDIDGGVSKVL